jgi:teichuronic acid biosynthesis glycosyltransferase TuaC
VGVLNVHVLIVPIGIYTLPKVPLGCIFERQQAEALQAAGAKVGVLSGGVITTRHLGHRFPYVERDQVNGVPVYRAHRRAYLPARWESPRSAAKRTYSRVKPLLEQYIRDHGIPDIVHAHNLSSGGLVARLIFDEFRIPYVVTEHTSTYAAELDAVIRDLPILVEAANPASTIIAVGTQLANNLRDAFVGEGSTPVVVVPNVVDPRFLAVPRVMRPGPFTVAGIGNLIPRKNYDLLLRAFARSGLPVDAHLVLGGTGPELNRLRATAKALCLSERVDFRGRLSRNGVIELLQGVDLFAHPSDSESFGVVLIEAMALGVPVLATASGGPEDIVTPDVGLLSAVGDIDAFADGLTDMYRSRAEFDPDEVREACRSQFGPEAFATRMLEVYRQAIA